MRRYSKLGFVMAVVSCLATEPSRAEPITLRPVVVTLPIGSGPPLFADVDGSGRRDLLVMSAEKEILRYRQHENGFGAAPDQKIALPPRTVWVAPFQVEAGAGLDLLACDAEGFAYKRLEGGQFAPEWRTLLAARQVFTNGDAPFLTFVSTNHAKTDAFIPVIMADQVVPYERASSNEWKPGAPWPLAARETAWRSGRGAWASGGKTARSLLVRQSFLAHAKVKPESAKAENAAIQTILDDMKTRETASAPKLERLDLNGDGRPDVVLWQVSGRLEFKTDMYLFLRGADGQLPARPTQVLHARGFPIPTSEPFVWSPFHDLDGDGISELVLLEPQTVFMSPSGLVEVALSRGVDWTLTVRTGERGVFSRSPVASTSLTMILALEGLSAWSICLTPDLNGDGRLDLLVRRSETKWNVFRSVRDGHWFEAEPGMTFDAPSQGSYFTQDVNGDGRADLVWRETETNRVSIFLSPPPARQGKNP